MATISETIAAVQEAHLRPFDARRDLGAVADLVELCFKETLDPEGREYLGRMRAAANSPAWIGWAAQAEWSPPAMGGFVWLQDGMLIGNVSLIPYYIKGQRFYLIANVAVHPDFRRQGIARRMTERAIAYARQRHAPSVWLHVREENQPAIQLYENLGFIERARRTTWYSVADFEPAHLSSGERILAPRSEQWPSMRKWLTQNYPTELSWHMPLRINWLNPGITGGFYRLLYNAEIHQWALFENQRFVCSVSWQLTASRANFFWLAAPAECAPRQVHALLAHVRQQIVAPRPMMLDYPARQHEAALQAAGFLPHQTLIWMELPLQKKP
ncbi:MAG: GNAT family N-acetyltransferase [Anaerolineales bacterium]|nr:GNAT family N-acetyltransferase [Anaerolineales bacterium]